MVIIVTTTRQTTANTLGNYYYSLRSGWEIIAMGKGWETFAPLFADRSLTSELRISALEMLFFSKLNGAQMASIVTTLYRDPDYEVINYAYTLFERYANSIDPCDKSRAHLAGFFLKMMKQFSNRNVRMKNLTS